jgi:16S rRNA (cytosine1402-N4)-methyltransferase
MALLPIFNYRLCFHEAYTKHSRLGVASLAFVHETVLLQETVASVLPKTDGQYIDCTLGGAGHSEQLLRQSSPGGRLLAIDQDETALCHARERLSQYSNRTVFAHANFRKVYEVGIQNGFENVDGIIFDLGVSSPQFDEAKRGFSYRQDAPLDMRMDRTNATTAADLIRNLDEQELASIFFRYGEEKFSRRIARAITRQRAIAPVETTTELAELVKAAIPAATRRTGGHPAKRVFQALRIAVNDELGALEEAISGAFRLLRPRGRLAVITFHSLEDRIVKHMFVEWTKGCVCPPDFPICQCNRKPAGKLVARKPILPGDEEVEFNSRARSAKLRVIEKLAD